MLAPRHTSITVFTRLVVPHIAETGLHELRELPAVGYPSVKIFTTIEGFRLSDEQILQVLSTAASHGILVAVHAEDDPLAAFLVSQTRARSPHSGCGGTRLRGLPSAGRRGAFRPSRGSIRIPGRRRGLLRPPVKCGSPGRPAHRPPERHPRARRDPIGILVSRQPPAQIRAVRPQDSSACRRFAREPIRKHCGPDLRRATSRLSRATIRRGWPPRRPIHAGISQRSSQALQACRHGLGMLYSEGVRQRGWSLERLLRKVRPTRRKDFRPVAPQGQPRHRSRCSHRQTGPDAERPADTRDDAIPQ